MTEANVNPSSEVGTTSLGLLERARRRDPAAWVRLTELYGPLLGEWCRRAGLQPADASDVRQEVFAVVARTLDQFRHDRPGDTFRGWLYTITRNKIRDRARQGEVGGVGGSEAKKRFAALAARESEEESSRPDERRELYLRAIEQIRGEFETKTWRAFWLVTVDGWTAAEAAAELTMSTNAVYLARSRILRRLREEFAGLLDTDPGDSSPSPPPNPPPNPPAGS